MALKRDSGIPLDMENSPYSRLVRAHIAAQFAAVLCNKEYAEKMVIK